MTASSNYLFYFHEKKCAQINFRCVNRLPVLAQFTDKNARDLVIKLVKLPWHDRRFPNCREPVLHQPDLDVLGIFQDGADNR